MRYNTAGRRQLMAYMAEHAERQFTVDELYEALVATGATVGKSSVYRLCEKLCPLNNIELQNKEPVWGTNCTHCMACICGCPKEAIEYGRISKGKVRYQCPEYKG